MSLCYHFSKWTMLTLASVAISLTLGLVTIAYGQEWSTWVDPDKQFNLQYPSNWTVTPRENRFEDQDVLFNIDENSTILTINVYNTISTDLRKIMERAAATDSLPDTWKLFEGPDYVTYTVSGQPAGSIIWTVNAPFTGKSVYQNIASIVGDKFVGIVYSSPAQDFDKHFPIVQKVIQSIKIK